MDQFLDTIAMMCILEHANMEHTIFALAALQWLVIVKEGGKTIFQFKISPLEGHQIKSTNLDFFLAHVAPSVKGH